MNIPHNNISYLYIMDKLYILGITKATMF